jgi:hypothetical protein
MLGGFKNKHGNRYPSVEKEKPIRFEGRMGVCV